MVGVLMNAVRAEGYFKPSGWMKEMILGFAAAKQREIQIQILEPSGVYYQCLDDDESSCRLIDTEDGLRLYSKRIFPPVERRLIFDSYQRMAPDKSAKEILAMVARSEDVGSVYDMLLELFG